MSLPPMGRLERISRWCGVGGAVLWGVYLALVYIVPGIWEASVHFLDKILWPLIQTAGRWWGVASLSALTAVAIMLVQRFATGMDGPCGLKVVKKLVGMMRDSLHEVPEHSAGEKRIIGEIRAGEWRLARASLVPLGMLLGPVLLTFMWLPERVEPQHANPSPGQGMLVKVSVDGEFSGPVEISVDGALLSAEGAPARVMAESYRTHYENLRRDLQLVESGMPATAAVRDHLMAMGTSAREAREGLERLLAMPMPPRILQWSLATAAESPRQIVVRVKAEDGEHGGMGQVTLATGDIAPPPLKYMKEGDQRQILNEGEGVVKQVSVTYQELRPESEQAFWRPFGWAGWNWDAGWLPLYLLAYIPAMFLSKRVLRIP